MQIEGPSEVSPGSKMWEKDGKDLIWKVVSVSSEIWVCLKMVSTPKANGFADHYPYKKWLFPWEY